MAVATKFEELDAWQLSVELRDRIIDEIQKPPTVRDVSFCDQIRDAARSGPRNISEGFGAYQPREFARFTRIARRSLMETMNHLLEGRGRKYFVDPLASELLTLCDRALRATTGLLRYLVSCNGRAPRTGNRSTQSSAISAIQRQKPETTLRRFTITPTSSREPRAVYRER